MLAGNDKRIGGGNASLDVFGCALQERKSVANAGLKVRRLTGDDIKAEHWEAFYQGYINTTGCKPYCLCTT